MPREFSRSKRLGAQLLRTLNEVVRFEIKDPALEGMSLTAVDLSRDLSVAKVYFSLLHPDADPQPALDGLKRASGFLRNKVGAAMKIRHVPELRFMHDDSVAHAVEISKLIADATANDSSR
jgi:ribosome-binding factor A